MVQAKNDVSLHSYNGSEKNGENGLRYEKSIEVICGRL